VIPLLLLLASETAGPIEVVDRFLDRLAEPIPSL